MWKSLFGRSSAASLPPTAETLHRRSRLCQQLGEIYTDSISLLEQPPAPQTSLVSYYTDINSHLKMQLDSLKQYCGQAGSSLPEAGFRSALETQLDATQSLLESIHNQIKLRDLAQLDQNYNTRMDHFFRRFHANRIAVSYLLTEYVHNIQLVQTSEAKDIVQKGISSTSQILGLNGYPVPKFIIQPGSEVQAKCIVPHVAHILFEMFKNASIPSLNKKQPISISMYDTPEEAVTKHNSTKSENDKIRSLCSLNGNLSPTKFVTIEISDKGGGMPLEIVDKIWHFHYTTSKDKDTIHGFGLGLPLCRIFAEFNDGWLELHNEPGLGVRIKISLPTKD